MHLTTARTSNMRIWTDHQWFLPLLSIGISFFGLVEPVAAGKTDPAKICDKAAQNAARTSPVPLDVLRSITRTETGRGASNALQPWPWTVNMQGKGVWFDSEDQARVYVFRHFKKGARSFDVGCFQINYRWHGKEFNSIEEMFDPYLNAQYAAKFLGKLHDELGDWQKAVGAYHSRTEKYASRYLNRYQKVLESLPAAHNEPVSLLGSTQGRRTPSGSRRGSLVPLDHATTGSFFSPRQEVK